MNVYHETNIAPLDPRLQYYLTRQQTMADRLRFTSATDGYIPVIAIVTDLVAWQALSEVQPGATIPTQDGKYIVTARVPISRIEAIRTTPFVISLKATQPIKRALKETIRDFGLVANHTIGNIRVSKLQETSSDVVVGVVDYGGDFAHRNFRNQDGTTRIARIWDQGGAASASSPFGYGREIKRERINRALTRPDPYSDLGYDPRSYDNNGIMEPSHGTHVMDIAAGSGSVDDDDQTNSIGVAPQAELVFVELNSEHPGRGREVINSDFGDSVRVVEAVKYIFSYADSVGKPCVVNLSLGTNGGPHDGTNPVETAFDELVNAKPDRAIVIAACNSYSDGIHKLGKVAQGYSTSLQLNVPRFDRTDNETEIWYSGQDKFEVEVLDKSGQSLARLPLGHNGAINQRVNGVEKLLCFISHRKNDPNNHDNVIHFFEAVRNQSTAGMWTLRLHGINVVNGNYHAWIERDDYGQSSFEQPNNSYTLGSISCGHKSIAVGSYDAHKQGLPISYFSSAGPTRDGRKKPEVSAPGHDVWAASSGTGNRTTAMSGTSMAAPSVTGLIALMMGYSKSLGKELPIDTILRILRESARHVASDDEDANNWDERYGFGRISGNVFNHSFFAQPAAPQPIARTSAPTTSASSSSEVNTVDEKRTDVAAPQ